MAKLKRIYMKRRKETVIFSPYIYIYTYLYFLNSIFFACSKIDNRCRTQYGRRLSLRNDGHTKSSDWLLKLAYDVIFQEYREKTCLEKINVHPIVPRQPIFIVFGLHARAVERLSTALTNIVKSYARLFTQQVDLSAGPRDPPGALLIGHNSRCGQLAQHTTVSISFSLFCPPPSPLLQARACRLRREIKLFPNRPSYADMRHARNAETIISWLQQRARIRRKQRARSLCDHPPSGRCTIKPPTTIVWPSRYRKVTRKTA